MIDNNRVHTSKLFRRLEILIVLFMIVLTLTFIWGNSMKSRTESSVDSDFVYEGVYDEILKPPIESVLGSNVIDVGVIRKLAHVFEFMCLALEINYLVYLFNKYRLSNIPIMLLAGLFVGGMDEIIQIFYERGSQIVDVLIDFSGFLVMTLAFMLVYYTFRKGQKNNYNILSVN